MVPHTSCLKIPFFVVIKSWSPLGWRTCGAVSQGGSSSQSQAAEPGAEGGAFQHYLESSRTMEFLAIKTTWCCCFQCKLEFSRTQILHPVPIGSPPCEGEVWKNPSGLQQSCSRNSVQICSIPSFFIIYSRLKQQAWPVWAECLTHVFSVREQRENKERKLQKFTSVPRHNSTEMSTCIMFHLQWENEITDSNFSVYSVMQTTQTPAIYSESSTGRNTVSMVFRTEEGQWFSIITYLQRPKLL